MKFSRRVTRCALIAWALYLVIALTAFALHIHAPGEKAGPECALCLAQTVTGAATAVTVFVLVAPLARWERRLWLLVPQSPVISGAPRFYFSRGPPVGAFILAF